SSSEPPAGGAEPRRRGVPWAVSPPGGLEGARNRRDRTPGRPFRAPRDARAIPTSAHVNNVTLIGSDVNEPELSAGRDGGDVRAIQIAVQRRGPTGDPEPGVIYVDVTAYGRRARECATELGVGDRVGVAGRLARADSLGARGPRRWSWEVHAYQVE